MSEIRTTAPAPELGPVSVADSNVVNADLPGTSGASADGNGRALDELVAYTPAIQALCGTQGAEALVLQAMRKLTRPIPPTEATFQKTLSHASICLPFPIKTAERDNSRYRNR
ncbi:MAG: hypothetical protein P8J17_07375 [Halioglobus sp.]|nr:hypothetical protein [Halioglobus sp.]